MCENDPCLASLNEPVDVFMMVIIAISDNSDTVNKQLQDVPSNTEGN